MVFADSDVAQVGSDKYDTLQNAIDAADPGDTISLLDNVTESVTVDKKIKIDLNGKTVTSSTDTITVNGGDLTVTDSSDAATGKISTSSTDPSGYAYGAIEIKDGGKLTLEKGTISAPDYGIFAYDSAASVIINGGLVEATGSGDWAYSLYTRCYTEINGGTFTSNEHWVVYFSGSNKVTGGTFSSDCIKDTAFNIPEDYAVKDNGDTTYTVYKLEKAVKIGDKSYFTLAEAFADASENDIITITAAGEYVWPNTAIPDGVTVEGTVDGVVIEAAVKDDFGFTVNNLNNANKTTFKNLKFNSSLYDGKAAYVSSGSIETMTFEKCSFTGVYAFHVDSAKNAKFVFTDCIFNGFTTFASTVEKIEVTGGEINDAFILRQDATIDDVEFSEDAVVQLGTSDKVTDVDVEIKNSTVVKEDGTVSDKSVADLVNTNNGSKDNNNSVVVDEEVVIGEEEQTTTPGGNAGVTDPSTPAPTTPAKPDASPNTGDNNMAPFAVAGLALAAMAAVAATRRRTN